MRLSTAGFISRLIKVSRQPARDQAIYRNLCEGFRNDRRSQITLVSLRPPDHIPCRLVRLLLCLILGDYSDESEAS
jgi:hypothetical protein